MSFSFAFDVPADELDEELDLPTSQLASLNISEQPLASGSGTAVPHKEVPLNELLETLPPLLSYTPVTVPIAATATQPVRHVLLLRRDLFDARFQVLNQDEDGEGEDDKPKADKGKQKEELFIDEQTDLVKGVYEGGLKTWECSLDLVDCLAARGFISEEDLGESRVRGKSILEVGCGTAVPTCALFARLLDEITKKPTTVDAPRPKKTRIHLQDYNKQVLTLITLPNLLLTYANHLAFPSHAPDADEDVDPTGADRQPGELDVTPELLEAFEALLERENIELRFFEGDWSGMDEAVRAGHRKAETEEAEKGYDLVLTSETVYSIPSLEPLLDLLEAASERVGAANEEDAALCLVACKRIYFGVGGGELEFRRRVEARGGEVEAVWGEGEGKGKSSGVGRTVMSVRWAEKGSKAGEQ
ncbi:hypothetical protein JCM8097_006021 [Rhodosporidiobolus ruineniae]